MIRLHTIIRVTVIAMAFLLVMIVLPLVPGVDLEFALWTMVAVCILLVVVVIVRADGGAPNIEKPSSDFEDWRDGRW